MKNYVYKNIAIAGDIQGISILLKHLPKQLIGGIIAASNSPEIINYLEFMSHSLKVPLIIHLPQTSKNFNIYVEEFKNQNFDFLLSCGHTMIFEPEILSNINYKAINIHNSFLPKFKSQSAIQYAIMNNEKETGVSFHLIKDKLYDGEIIFQKKLQISETDTNVTLTKKINELKLNILKENIDLILENKFSVSKQKNSDGKILNKITEDKLKIDFNTMNDLQIYNLIRANTEILEPPFFIFNEEKIVYNQYLSLDEIKKERLKYS